MSIGKWIRRAYGAEVTPAVRARQQEAIMKEATRLQAEREAKKRRKKKK